jgi:hypothetical protein
VVVGKRSSVGIVGDWMRFCGESDIKLRYLQLHDREKDTYVYICIPVESK